MEIALFVALAAAALIPAFFVVRVSNMVHAALWLGASLLATASLYAMMGASFLAATQVLVYVGGVITLMLFGVMITRRHEGLAVPAESANTSRAAALAVGLFGILAAAIRATRGLDVPLAAPDRDDTAALGRALVVDHVLTFEALSVLLLVAIVGAVVIARRRDPGDPREVTP